MARADIIQNIYPLSPMQSGMLFHSLTSMETSAYFEQCLFTITGEIDKILLEKCFKLLVRKYDIFRTVFRANKVKKPLQIVLRDRYVKLHSEDVSHLSKVEAAKYVEEFKRKDRERGFDLNRDILIRLSLLKTEANTYQLVFSFHHIIMDGWCLGIIFKDIIEMYGLLREGESLKLQEVPPFVNYIRWLEKQDRQESLKFWREYLDGYDGHATLPRTPGVGGDKGYQWSEYRFTIDEEITSRLENIARKIQVTINTVIQTTWGILLQRYNNSDDVVFGVVVSGRPAEVDGIEDMVGLFINTTPLRIKCTNGKLSQLLRDIQQNAAAAKPYEYISLAEIQSISLLKRDLIDHAIAFENYPVRDLVSGGSIKKKLGFNVIDMEAFEQTNYDFNLLISPGKQLHAKCIYNSSVYDRVFFEKMALHFKEILKQIVENPEKDISEIGIVSEEERLRILRELRKENIPLIKEQQNQPRTKEGTKKIEADFDF